MVAGLLVLVFVVCFGFFIVNRPAQHHGIILFIGDGFGPASSYLSRNVGPTAGLGSDILATDT